MVASMSEKLEVFSVTTQIKGPTENHPGQFAEGCYTVADDAVTLTDRNGIPVRDNDGKFYKRKMAGQPARLIAARLTKEFRRALLGKNHIGGFNGPISYPKSGFI